MSRSLCLVLLFALAGCTTAPGKLDAGLKPTDRHAQVEAPADAAAQAATDSDEESTDAPDLRRPATREDRE